MQQNPIKGRKIIINIYRFFVANTYAISIQAGIAKLVAGSSTIKDLISFCIKTRKAQVMSAKISSIFRTRVDFTDPFARFLADLQANAPSKVTGPATSKLLF
jgi:hypothetical protein